MTKKFRTRNIELKTVRDGDTLRIRVRGPLVTNNQALNDAILRLLRDASDEQEMAA